METALTPIISVTAADRWSVKVDVYGLTLAGTVVVEKNVVKTDVSSVLTITFTVPSGFDGAVEVVGATPHEDLVMVVVNIVWVRVDGGNCLFDDMVLVGTSTEPPLLRGRLASSWYSDIKKGYSIAIPSPWTPQKFMIASWASASTI